MKRLVLWLAFGATLIAMYFAPPSNDAVVVVPAKAAVQAPSNSRAVGVPVQQPVPQEMDLRIRRRNADEDLGNVFASHSWTPPPKPVEKPREVTPAPSEAPPLPFRFIGRMIDEGKTAYFLQFNDRNLVLHIGESVDKTYTLDGMSNGALTFTYLPLNQKQTLVVGEVN